MPSCPQPPAPPAPPRAPPSGPPASPPYAIFYDSSEFADRNCFAEGGVKWSEDRGCLTNGGMVAIATSIVLLLAMVASCYVKARCLRREFARGPKRLYSMAQALSAMPDHQVSFWADKASIQSGECDAPRAIGQQQCAP